MTSLLVLLGIPLMLVFAYYVVAGTLSATFHLFNGYTQALAQPVHSTPVRSEACLICGSAGCSKITHTK